MAKVSDTFGSKSWKAADLDEGPQVLTMTKVQPFEFDDGNKLIVSFKDSDKDLICNKTNANTIVESYGDDTDEWIGKRIQLYKAMTEYQGKRVPCVRVQGPKSTTAAPPPPDFGDDSPPTPDDDMPF